MNRFAGVRTNYRTVYLTPNSIGQIKLPKDFVSYRAVGVCVNGHIVTLTLCEDICLAHGCDECGNPISEQPVITNGQTFTPGYFFQPAWRNGQWVGEQYGVPAGQNYRGYYRFDYNAGVIQLSGVIPQTEIVLEYTSNATNLCGQTNVPDYITEAITAFVVWHSLLDQSERETARRDYLVEYEKVVTFVNLFTGSEAKDEFYQQTRSSARR
jgi:hypothetical protein